MKANEKSETYPIQFRDKIDEYLWKEHHILGGCCSSIGEMKYSVAREVAEKLTNVFIKRAKKWFEQQPETYDANGVRVYGEEGFEDFKAYMKGE